MSKPKLTYFSSRGLIEPLRLLLIDAGVDYERNDLGAFSSGSPPAAFLELKASGILDYGSVPVWEEEGFSLVQSASIVRHVARRYGYNGDNEFEASKIDSIVEGCKDFIQAIRKFAHAPADQRAQIWKDAVAGDIPKWLGFFESILKKNDSGFLVGKKISYADFFVAYNTEELKGVGIDISSFPLLSSHFSFIYERPNVAAYVTSPSRYPSVFKNNIPKAIGTILKQFRHKTTPTTTKPTTPTTPTATPTPTATATATATPTTTTTTKTKTTVHSEVKRLLSRRDFTAAQKLFSLSPSPFPATSLISFASRELSSLSIAFSIYDSLKKTKGVSPDSFVFTALVGACQKLGGSSNIPSLWQDITHYKIKVDSRLYTTLISVCIAANDTVTLRQILSQIDKDQLQPDIILQTFLVKAYSIVGEIEKAFKIWENIKKEGSMKIDAQLLVSILTLCSETKSLERGREVHKVINESRICEKSKKDELALKSSLVNMYAKCGNLQDAQAVFNSMQSRDIVSWTAMLQAYSINGSMQEALQLYNEMNKHGIAANNFTYSIILSVMADMTNLNEGKRIHNQIKETYGCVINYPQVVVNALISMYAKCGDLDQVFEEYKSKANTVTWTAIIQSYSIHGFAKQALDLFQQMTQHKMTPNQTTLICIITACSHAGLVETAWDIYRSMQQKFGIKPDIRHQACMVDAWGRAGMLDSAEKFILGLADQNVIFWKTLLGASCNYRDVERSQRVAAKILQVEPNDASTYVLLANTYGAAGMMNEQASVWKQMLDNNIKKTPGATWVTVNGKSDVFYVDSSHLHKHDIMNFLAKTRTQLINEYQYEPELSCVLHPNLSEQEKIERLWTHSEKMATAWAILNNEPGPIIMHKNLRVCQDCHKAMKLMSRLFSKTFIVRDANRFHHFEDGKCSCNEYW